MVSLSQWEDCSSSWARDDPKLASAYATRATTYLHKGQYDLAIGDFSKAIELDPDDTWAYNDRAAAYIGKGQYDLAITDCTKAIELDPNFAKAYKTGALPIKNWARKLKP